MLDFTRADDSGSIRQGGDDCERVIPIVSSSFLALHAGEPRGAI